MILKILLLTTWVAVGIAGTKAYDYMKSTDALISLQDKEILRQKGLLNEMVSVNEKMMKLSSKWSDKLANCNINTTELTKDDSL